MEEGTKRRFCTRDFQLAAPAPTYFLCDIPTIRSRRAISHRCSTRMSTIHRSKPALQPHCYSSNRSSVGHSAIYLKPETLPRYNSDLSSRPESFRDTVISCLASIQSVASVLHADSEISQTRVFRFTFPIAVFLSVLSTIALLPHAWVILDDHLAEASFLCIVATFVVLGTLASLWLLIRVSALFINRFMEKDFTGPGRSSVGTLDNVMGGWFTN